MVTFLLRRLPDSNLFGDSVFRAIMEYTMMPAIITKQKYLHNFDPPAGGGSLYALDCEFAVESGTMVTGGIFVGEA